MKAIDRTFSGKGIKIPNGLTIIGGKAGSGKTRFQQVIINKMQPRFNVKVFLQETDIDTFNRGILVKKKYDNFKIEIKEVNEFATVIANIEADLENENRTELYFIESVDAFLMPKGQNAQMAMVYLAELAHKHNISIVATLQAHSSSMDDKYPKYPVESIKVGDLFLTVEKLNVNIDSSLASFLKAIFFLEPTVNYTITILANTVNTFSTIRAVFDFAKIKLKLL